MYDGTRPLFPALAEKWTRSVLFSLHFFEVGVDDVVALVAAAALCALSTRGGSTICAPRRPLLHRPLVHGLGELVGALAQRFGCGADRVDVALLDRLLGLFQGRFDARFRRLVEIALVVLERLLRLIDQAVELVLGVDGFPALAVLLRVRLGLL